MSILNEFQFELLPSLAASEGQVFGIGSHISTNEDGFHPGSTSWTTQDTPSPITGHVNFGRDVLNGPVWAWDLHVNRDDTPEAVESLAAFTSAWRALHIRRTPGLMLPLRYRIADRVRRIYGRPGNIEPGINNLLLSGYADITCDFQAVDAFTYSDGEDSLTLTVGESDSGAGGGGFVFPLTFPYGSAPPTEQQAQVVVGGDAPTHPIVRFNGPVENPALETDDWRLSLNYSIPVGQYVEIDTRPWVSTVLLNGDTSIAGSLGRRISLPNITFEPGSLEARFIGSSSTGTATCTIRWSSAWNSI